MLRLLILFSILIQVFFGTAQSCCSGGVPVSSNLGFQSTQKGIFQLSATIDFNILKTLKSGSERLDDDQRLRTTQSLIFRGAYSFSNKFTVEGFFPIVRQTRRISTVAGNFDREQTFGIGDPIALLIYNVLDQGITFRMGLGTQIPLGSHNQTNSRGLILLEDLQPGSGAWDVIFFGSLEFIFPKRPTTFLYINTIASHAGTNAEARGGLQNYKFGNDIQFIAGISDQLLLFNQIISPGLSFRYRKAQRDEVDKINLPGTGGEFVFTRISNSIPFSTSGSSINFTLEIPIWSRVNETQLSPSLVINIGWHKKFNPLQSSNSLIDLN